MFGRSGKQLRARRAFTNGELRPEQVKYLFGCDVAGESRLTGLCLGLQAGDENAQVQLVVDYLTHDFAEEYAHSPAFFCVQCAVFEDMCIMNEVEEFARLVRLARAFAMYTPLKHLTIDSGLGDEYIADICQAFCSLVPESRTSLFDASLLSHLAADSAQQCRCQLEMVNFTNQYVTDFGLANAIGTLLQSHCETMKHVLLASNQIGQNGIEALSAALRHCHALESLDLSTNHTEDGSAEICDGRPLFAALSDKRNLRSLELSYNKLDRFGFDDSVEISAKNAELRSNLKAIFTQNDNLTLVSLTRCQLGADFVEALFEAVLFRGKAVIQRLAQQLYAFSGNLPLGVCSIFADFLADFSTGNPLALMIGGNCNPKTKGAFLGLLTRFAKKRLFIVSKLSVAKCNWFFEEMVEFGNALSENYCVLHCEFDVKQKREEDASSLLATASWCDALSDAIGSGNYVVVGSGMVHAATFKRRDLSTKWYADVVSMPEPHSCN